MIPVRNRPEKIPGLIKSYDEATTGPGTDLMFISDDDDDSYKDTDWGNHVHAVLSPREYVVGKMNRTALSCADSYDAIMFAQDDNLFVTHGWDEIMLSVLEGMGGTGMIYPDDKRRNDVPEIIMISSDIITELGWFAAPFLNHYYTDHVWSDLGRGAGLLRFVPEAVVEHQHYSVHKGTQYDSLYHEMEDKFGVADRDAYMQWRATAMPFQVSQLRRKFNPDVAWLLERVLCGSNHGAGGHRRHGGRVHHPPRRLQRHSRFSCRDNPGPGDEQIAHLVERVRRVHLPDDFRRVLEQRGDAGVRAEHRRDHSRGELHPQHRGVIPSSSPLPGSPAGACRRWRVGA